MNITVVNGMWLRYTYVAKLVIRINPCYINTVDTQLYPISLLTPWIRKTYIFVIIHIINIHNDGYIMRILINYLLTSQVCLPILEYLNLPQIAYHSHASYHVNIVQWYQCAVCLGSSLHCKCYVCYTFLIEVTVCGNPTELQKYNIV